MRQLQSFTLLYRYFFFGWLFRDATRGNLFEQSAAWQHNKAQAHCLLTYLKRWTILAVGVFAAGSLCAVVFEGHWISVPFFVFFSVAITMASVIVVAWLGMRLLSKPHHGQ